MIHAARQTGKFAALKRLLREQFPGLPVSVDTVATGLLELLWHFTAASAKRGDIGRYDNEIIAEAVGWHGCPDALIRILVTTKWIDEHPEYRLVVHDWHEHCPSHIKRNIDRIGGFVGPARDVKRPLTYSGEQGSAHLPTQVSREARTPNLTKPNVTKPNQIEDSDESSCVHPAVQVVAIPSDGKSEFVFSTRSGPWWLPRFKLAEYQATYQIDVEAELRKAAQWLRDNPGKRKTKSGMKAFLTRWLNGSTDTAGDYDRKKRAGQQLEEQARREREAAARRRHNRETLAAVAVPPEERWNPDERPRVTLRVPPAETEEDVTVLQRLKEIAAKETT